tara:strand:- start:1248 stop:1442 length:195 start_codon:yes stop_codon:yes gene_type:complete
MAINVFDKIRAIKKISSDRLKVCDKCDWFDKKLRRCTVCGCFMDAKTKIPSKKCPKGKWGKVSI